MKEILKLLSEIVMDLEPEADNAIEAIDLYSQRIYKRIHLKEQAGINITNDIELYLLLNGYKSEIAEMVHKKAAKEARCSGL